jgi:predicted small metal-binding protein
MRVIECNECGTTISAANDDELTRELSNHMTSDHPDADWGNDQAHELVASQAYDAMDS